jgi:murein DD-endopeptidase MepM/ murein hydrolase activator NlpD
MEHAEDEAQQARSYVTPHHFDWIERFKALVARAVSLSKPDVLPPSTTRIPIPPPAPVGIGERIRLGEPGWLWPMERSRDGRAPVISDGVHPKGDMKFRNGAGHRGCDLMFAKAKNAPFGSVLNHPWESRGFEVGQNYHALAAAPGRVVTARWLVTGYCVAIDHGFGVTTAHHHMAQIARAVGDEVAAGDQLGVVGCPPAATPGGRPGLVHLHFDLLIGAKFVDPQPYLVTWAVVPARVNPPPTVA